MNTEEATFLSKLDAVQIRHDSLLCVGLDTDRRLIPPHLGSSIDAVLEFNRSIIDATSDLVCAFKLNLAFYERLGDEGWRVVRETLRMIPSHIVTIGDGKRGDIGNTAAQYASALFDDLGFDAVTVNPYMGYDSVEPFLNYPSKGTIVLALTSNSGSRDFQRLKVGTKPLYERVVAAARKWNIGRNVGLVVGATHPGELKRIRAMVPSMPILIPGIGAQGGDLRSAVRYGCMKNGRGAVLTSSRAIVYASREKGYAEAARQAAVRLFDQIRRHRREFFGA